MELDQEGMICVAGTIISLSEYAMKNRCAYGSFGYYRFSTAFRLAIFGSNFSYWFEIVNPIFITTNESLKTVYNWILKFKTFWANAWQFVIVSAFGHLSIYLSVHQLQTRIPC